MLFLSCVLLDFVEKSERDTLALSASKCDPVCMAVVAAFVCLRTLTDTIRNRILCRYDDGSKPQCSTARISHMTHFHYHKFVPTRHIYVAAMALFYEIRLYDYISLPITCNFFVVKNKIGRQ